MILNYLLLMPPADGKSGGGWENLIFIVLIFVTFWFFMIRPQIKRQKAQQKFKDQIGKGDKIITTGGIHGKIVEVADTTFIIEVEGQNRLKIEKTAVSMELTQALNKEKK